MIDLQTLLDISSRDHGHLCPRQILGVRIGLRGISALRIESKPGSKRLLVIAETDGCFVDGITAATQCTLGHRTLRVEDYGKVAATFIDTQTGRAVRIAPAASVRQRAYDYAPDEKRHYFAQMQAYQVMPDDELLDVEEVALSIPIAQIVSRPGMRVNCDICGEEIMNEREVHQDGLTLCRACAFGGYYHLQERTPAPLFTIGQEAAR